MKQQIFNLGKNSLIYGFGSVITRFISLFTLPIFTSYLRPEEYGVLAMLALLSMVAQPLFSLGLGPAMGPCYYENVDVQSKSTVVWTTFSIYAISSFLLMLIGWVCPSFVSKLVRLSTEHNLLIGLTLTGCAFAIMSTPLSSRLQFENQPKLFVVVSLTTSLTTIVVSMFTVLILGLGAKGMIIGQLLGNAVALIMFLIVSIRNTQFKVCVKIAGNLLRLGLPLVPGFAFLFALMHANKFILEAKFGLDTVGVYSIGFNLGMPLTIVTAGITTAWYPFFMKYIDRQSEASYLFGKIFTLYTIGVGFLTICFFIFAKPMVLILTDIKFHSAYQVIGLVAAANYVIGFYYLFLPPIYFKKEIYIQSLIQGSATVLSLPIVYYCVDMFGLLGAGFSLVFGHLLVVVFTYLWVSFRRRDYMIVHYEWQRVIKFFIFFLATVISMLSIQIESLMLNLLFSGVVIIIVAIFIIQLLSKSELKSIPVLRRFKLTGINRY